MPLYVPLSRPVQEALQRLAWEEKRNPRMQASWLIEQRLRELGTLPPTGELKTEPAPETATA